MHRPQSPVTVPYAATVTDGSARLAELEEIKQLKARYCRLLDTKKWAEWRMLFADDFRSDTSPAGGKLIVGADDFVAFTRRSVGERATVHQVHAPEIEFTSTTTARAIWALEDVVRLAPGVNLRGYGHYHETYEKVDGQWYFTSSTLTRIREDIFNMLTSVYLSDRIKKAAGAVARRLVR
ncbi:nuclear transport factor 2 family protein [Mycobacterium sp. SMC-4]|nr:nuclear transport factor 2 family protein [Mycobacterium sp. SMC-4]UXA20688.1 nuclear transport factor 2 family protein [Mycobacterium sp. SMC-4]